MTRIVSGLAGSLRLRVPRNGTRPTSDRVREAIFSALESRDAIEGSAVLDLFAGSGALGLEAASRGAASVELVERNAQAAQLCRENARAIATAITRAGGSPGPVRVAATSVQQFLERNSGPWDLVFIDPPYELGEAELGSVLGALGSHLTDDAVVVVERSSRSPEPGWPNGLEPARSKSYGETVVWWAYPAPPSHPR